MSLNFDEENLLRPLAPIRTSPKCFWTFKHTVIGLLILFPYVTIPILFAMVANIDKTTNNYNNAIVTASFPINSQSFRRNVHHVDSSSSLSVYPLVLSLNSNGQLQIGAGTTIYKNQSSYQSDCPVYLDLDSVFDTSYILSYYDKVSDQSTFAVVEVNSDDARIASTYTSSYDFYQLSVLDESSGLFVFITEDASSTAETAYIVAGMVNSNSYAVSLGNPVAYTSIYSLNPIVTPLSASTFAISYYDFTVKPNTLSTRYGSVDSTTLAITLSPAYQVIADPLNSIYNTILGLTENNYLISYYNSNTTEIEAKTLTSILATVTIPDNGAAFAVISFSSPAYLDNSFPAYYLASTKINNNTAMVAFADKSSNYGLRAVVISIDQAISSSPIFTSSLLVTSGRTFTTIDDGVVPDLDISTVFSSYQRPSNGKASGSAIVSTLFSNLGNNGAMEMVLLQISSSGSIVRISPNYVLNDGNPSFTSSYSWGALATAISQKSFSQSLIVSAVQSIDCSGSAIIEFSIMENMPLSVGLSQSSLSPYDIVTSTIEVVLSGTVSGFADLVTGMPYYATTKGSLVKGNDFYGEYPTVSFSSTSYIDTSTGHSSSIITSLDSFVGIAVSSDTLLLVKS